MDFNEYARLEPGLLDSMPDLRSVVIGSPFLQEIPDGLFENHRIHRLTIFESPLLRTTRGAFRGVINIEGLPKTFDVEPSEQGREWMP